MRITRVSSQCRRSLSSFAALLQEAIPRTVNVGSNLARYKHNAESDDWPCGIGGVLLNPAKRLVAAFSALVPEWFRQLLGEGRV